MKLCSGSASIKINAFPKPAIPEAGTEHPEPYFFIMDTTARAYVPGVMVFGNPLPIPAARDVKKLYF